MIKINVVITEIVKLFNKLNINITYKKSLHESIRNQVDVEYFKKIKLRNKNKDLKMQRIVDNENLFLLTLFKIINFLQIKVEDLIIKITKKLPQNIYFKSMIEKLL